MLIFQHLDFKYEVCLAGGVYFHVHFTFLHYAINAECGMNMDTFSPCIIVSVIYASSCLFAVTKILSKVNNELSKFAAKDQIRKLLGFIGAAKI